jgi:hypothetical protein
MQYIAIPWHCFHPQDAKFARFLTLLRENPVKRFSSTAAPATTALEWWSPYRMAEQGWTAKEARKEMEAYGFTSSHHFICLGLSSYEAKFPRRFQTSPAFRNLRRSWHIRQQ